MKCRDRPALVIEYMERVILICLHLGVPYSEHSNFEELCRFIKFVKADKIIPTVPMKNRQMYGLLKSLVDSYKGGAKQQRIDQFMSK